jgi:CubicO group peptidase (beta-lactamase class C family)
MTSSPLTELLDRHVRAGKLPGAVAAVANGPDDLEVAVVGARDVDGPPMTRDTIFRIASNSKPITAAATMLLVDEGRLDLDDPVERWLPELASPVVVRTPQAPVDDVAPARRAITARDLLTFRSGHGFAADFALPAVAKLVDDLHQGPPAPRDVVAPDDWMRILSTVPLLHHPGDAWLYNTGSDILGVLVARVAGRPFAEFLAERIFAPFGMRDTGFHVPAADLDRFTTAYRLEEAELVVNDPPDGQWTTAPAFASGSGGLVSTLDDLLAFQQMLLAGGAGVLSPEAVALMTTDHLTAEQRAASTFFLDGQGWGFGGSVDVERTEPWNVPGRYGWIGGFGTAAYVDPVGHSTTVLLTAVGLESPAPPVVMRDFWAHAAQLRT